VDGQGAQGASASVDQGKKRRREYAGLEGDAGNESKEERLEAIKRTSWWLPQFTPEAEGKDLEPPPKRPASPVSGEPLRVKDLTAAILSKDEAGNVICPVTQREMKSQQAVIITPSGYIMLESAAEQFALPSMTCPMTGKKIKSRHIQQLQRSGSSFAAAGQVEAEVYRPTMR
jgi:nitric oxide synthase-interacting protein